MRAIFDGNPAAILLCDAAGRIECVNPALCRLTGYEASVIQGHDLAFLFSMPDAIQAQRPEVTDGVEQPDFWLMIRHHDGHAVRVYGQSAPVALPDDRPGRIWVISDILGSVDGDNQLLRQTTHDPLTHLPNRLFYEQDLPRVMARARRNDTVFAVCLLDIDDLKVVNDRLGYEAGDRLLRQFAQRLQSLLRESDLLAHLGGDEFILVVEELDRMEATAQLSVLLDRYHQAVERSFEFDSLGEVAVDMSLGVALFPFDGETSVELLNFAGKGLYRAKQAIDHHSAWWCRPVAHPSADGKVLEFDPYGDPAAQLLERAQVYFDETLESFVGAFYDKLWHGDEARRILEVLTQTEWERLKQHQIDHWRMLLDPAVSRDAVFRHSRVAGVSHGLVGVTAAMLSRAVDLFRQLLSRSLSHGVLPDRERYRTLLVVEKRLQDDLHEQLSVQDTVLRAYTDCLSLPLPAVGSRWVDASHRDIRALGALPGIRAAVLMRLDSDGHFVINESAGPCSREVQELYRTPGMQVSVDMDSEQGFALCAEAWRNRRIVSTPSFSRDPRYVHWHVCAEQFHIRSVLAIPIIGSSGQTEAVLAFYGAYPNQFESATMQHFARGVQQHWDEMWQRCGFKSVSLSEERALEFKQRLFSGGLEMFVQPIVGIHGRSSAKIEALARLRTEEGEYISPGTFLPLLGDAELNRLFRRGLDAALAYLEDWDAQGFHLAISVNLPPSALKDESCPEWVEHALREHDVEAGRLTLELLETEEIDVQQRDAILERIVGLGVLLAMDDLGSGYSSLKRLSTLPFESIKVDQALLLRVRENPLQTISLVHSIIQIAGGFGHKVVVEGVEDIGMLEMVSILGADFVQGYHIARPMPADRLLDWCRHHRPQLPDVDIEHVELKSHLGALTFHWWYVHHANHPLSEAECPLGRFFSEKGLERQEVGAWHVQTHLDPNDERASSQLMGWLAEQVRAGAI